MNDGFADDPKNIKLTSLIQERQQRKMWNKRKSNERAIIYQLAENLLHE